MSLQNEVRNKMNEALKNGNKELRSVYSNLLDALNKKSKELLTVELTKEQETEVICKLFKQNSESIKMCPENRIDILNNLNFERSVLEMYMPKQMSNEEVEEIISNVIKELGLENPSTKDKGKIMKVLMPRVKGLADGKVVNQILLTKIS